MISEKKKTDDVASESNAYRWQPFAGVDARACIEEDEETARVFVAMVTEAAEQNAFVVLKLRASVGGGTAAGRVSFIDSKKVVIGGIELNVDAIESGWVQ